VLGLTIGIASCLLIFLVVQFEMSFDRFHQKKDRIYRVVTQFNRAGAIDYTSGVSRPVPIAMRGEFPQLETVGAISGSNGNQITVLDNQSPQKKYKEPNIFYAEPEVFDILDARWLAGNAKSSLSSPNSVVLSKKTAEKYFGDWRHAVGQLIKHENRETLKVTGIIDDMPANTDFPFCVVISYKTSNEADNDDWGSTSSDFNCMILLKPNVSPAQISRLLPEFRSKHAKDDNGSIKASYLVQPLNEIHFDSRFGNYNERTFSRELITSLSLIGLFLLIIACVNFINLATAQAINRAKEVGVRKVLGSSRRQLVSQFLGETFLITIFSMAIACLISWFVLPYLGLLLDIQLTPASFQLSKIIAFLIIIVAAVTFLSGFYPAIILSGFNPVNAIKNKLSSKSVGGISLRRALVIFQFVIAQVLIIGTLVVISQMDYFKSASMGFDKNAIVNIPLPGDSLSHAKIDMMRQELLNYPGIKNVSFSFTPPANDGDWTSDFTFNKSPEQTSFEPSLKWADADFLKTYQLELVAGRFYVHSDTVNEFVVNEALVKKLGIKNPQDILGKEISFWNRRIHAPVVGVIRDFHSNSLRDPIAPVVLGSLKRRYGTIGIKIQESKTKDVLAFIEKLWNRNFPDYVYEYKFLDDKIKHFYDQENQLSHLYKIFAGIAIFISCLGLYGLVSFMAIQRTKEVGIRKVLGASVSSIVYLFSKEFTILISVAFLIAAPLSYYFMQHWLNNFTFRIKIGIEFFILAIIGSIVIAWITVGYKAIRAAVANPVKSLRTE
jgi:ABC-type antimicrobial peptide transport system permease subunit